MANLEQRWWPKAAFTHAKKLIFKAGDSDWATNDYIDHITSELLMMLTKARKSYRPRHRSKANILTFAWRRALLNYWGWRQKYNRRGMKFAPRDCSLEILPIHLCGSTNGELPPSYDRPNRTYWTPAQWDTLLSELSESERALVVGRFVEGRTYRELGVARGRSRSWAQERVDFLAARLRERLIAIGGEWDGVPSSVDITDRDNRD